MMRLTVMRTTPGKEEQELLYLCSIRFTSLRNPLKAPQITAHTNVSQNSSSSHILTSTVKRSLLLMNQAFMVELLQTDHR